MPTANPRITITLQPAVSAILKRVSDLTGDSQSSVVASLLEQSMPVFERLVRVLEAASIARESLKTAAVDELEAGQAKLEAQLGLALDTIDEGFRPILEEAERVKRRAAGAGGRRGRAPAPAAGRATPMSNRGVRSPQQKVKAQAKKGSR